MFTPALRKIMYTTNPIESLNSQYIKVTKNKPIFPTDESLLKILYLTTQKVAEKWTRFYQNWDFILSQLNIFFEDIFNQTI